MTLTNRLSAAFLGAMAVILVGFSVAIYALAATTLHRSVDDRLDAALITLVILAEDEPDGLDWERAERSLSMGDETGHDQVRWLVIGDGGMEVDRSKNLKDANILLKDGSRLLDHKGHPWRVVQRQLRSTHPASPGPNALRSNTFLLSAGLPLDSVDRPLQRLAIALPILSTTLWGLTAMVGRRLCRSALAPLTKMAVGARGLGADEPARRLMVPATGDELQDLAVAFNDLLDRWHEALERQSRFAGDASHQLRTPLTALIGQVDVSLRRERPPDEYRRTLESVRDQSYRLHRIVESLLYLARADAEAWLPSLEVFELSAWSAEHVRRRMECRGVTTRWVHHADEHAYVRAHPSLLAEVLDNLLDNAIDHGRGVEPIEVRVSRESSWVVLAVEDHGQGIDRLDLPRIFEPFYRSIHAQRVVPGGVGLGLAVARRIILSHGGRLEVQSQPQVGSRFLVTLPEALEPGPLPEERPD